MGSVVTLKGGGTRGVVCSLTLNRSCALMPHKRLPINCVNKPKVVNLNDLYLQTERGVFIPQSKLPARPLPPGAPLVIAEPQKFT